jgi:hypothetical protein
MELRPALLALLTFLAAILAPDHFHGFEHFFQGELLILSGFFVDSIGNC